MTTAEHEHSSSAGLWPLWFGMLAGPIAWSVRLLVSYPLVPVACARGGDLLLHLVTLATALVALAAGLVSWRRWRRAGETGQAGAGERRRRDRFMALFGVFSSGFFFLVILVEGSMVFLVSACT